LRRYDHPYYNSTQHEQPKIEIEKLEGLLGNVEQRVQFTEKYEEDYFDCSEMSAYMEYYLEREGYRASIFVNSNHAWVMVYSTGGWMPIEATHLFIPTPTNCKDYSVYSEPEERYDSIGQYWDSIVTRVTRLSPDASQELIQQMAVRLMSGVDWWETTYADTLAKLAEGDSQTSDIHAFFHGWN
jgi:hypothetical protein